MLILSNVMSLPKYLNASTWVSNSPYSLKDCFGASIALVIDACCHRCAIRSFHVADRLWSKPQTVSLTCILHLTHCVSVPSSEVDTRSCGCRYEAQLESSTQYFLDTSKKEINLLGTFTIALCFWQVSGPAYDTLAEGTHRGTISYVVQTF